LIYTTGVIPHRSTDKLSAMWNLAYADGHVATVRDTNLLTYPGVQWPYTYTGSGTPTVSKQGINSFDDALDTLETEAAGRNPNVEVADPNDKFFGYAMGTASANPFVLRLVTGTGASPGDGSYPGDSDHPQVPWK
jgi:hypothetical protein